MRVITGQARGTRLEAPAGTAVRPTTDMVKEAVFSILQFEIVQARVLDLFAGSGQLGIEALSRGAKSAVLVDKAQEALQAIRSNLQRTRLLAAATVVASDASAYLSRTGEEFDIAFLDPPYQKQIIDAVLPGLVAKMAPRGVIVCETEKNEQLPQKAGDFSIYKSYGYGKKKITVYRRPEDMAE